MWDYVTPQDYGAVGDGTTNDAPAFQAALNSGYPVYVPRTPNGYALANTVYLYGSQYPGSPPAPPVWQILQGSGALLKAASNFSGSALLQIGAYLSGVYYNGWYVQISGLTIDMSNVTWDYTGGMAPVTAAIYFDTVQQPSTAVEMSFIRLTDLTFQNCFMAITDVINPSLVTSSTIPVNDVQVKNVLCRRVGGRPQIAFSRSAGFILFRDVHIDLEFNTFPWPSTGPLAYLSNPSNAVAYAQFGVVSIGTPTSGIEMTGYPLIGGLEFERFDINSGGSVDNSPGGLTIIGDSSNPLDNQTVYLTRVLLDEIAGTGITINYMGGVFGKDLYSSNTTEWGIALTNVVYANLVNVFATDAHGTEGFDGLYVSGCQYVNVTNGILTGNSSTGLRLLNAAQPCNFSNLHVLNNVVGILAVGSTDIQFSNVYIASSTSHGMELNGSYYCHIVNAVSVNNSGYGFYTLAGTGASCDGNVFVDLKANGNGGGSLYVPPTIAPNSAAADWIPASGVFRSLDVSGSSGINV